MLLARMRPSLIPRWSNRTCDRGLELANFWVCPSSVHKLGASTNLLTNHDLTFLRLRGFAKSLQHHRRDSNAHQSSDRLND